jgi:flagellar hook-associated protein 2
LPTGQSEVKTFPRPADTLSVSTASSTPATTLLPFTGISQYASDFDAALSKAVQVAQIPVTLLQAQDSTVLQQETAMGSLYTDVAAFATSLSALGTLAAGQALSATSSDPTLVTATSTGATSGASYTIDSITSIASTASATSTHSFAASGPVSSMGEMNLVVGSSNNSITLTDNNLVGLENQINALGVGVTASILTTSSGNFLSLSANSTGAAAIQLFDDPTGANTNILTQTQPGSNASFSLNGIPDIQASNVVNDVIPGVTFTLLGTTPVTAPLTISLASDPTQLSSALQNFVTSYNTVQADVTAQTGQSGGALVGNTVVNQLQNALSQIGEYTLSTGTVQSLSDLGITFNGNVLSFNQTTFNALSSQQISDAFNFIGSATTGLGGLSSSISQLSDPITGVIATETAGLKQTDKDLQTQISAKTAQIAALQTSLTLQFEAADALQAELQNQQESVQAALQGVSLALYGKNETQF